MANPYPKFTLRAPSVSRYKEELKGKNVAGNMEVLLDTSILPLLGQENPIYGKNLSSASTITLHQPRPSTSREPVHSVVDNMMRKMKEKQDGTQVEQQMWERN